jgi:predicted dehydrogenase
MQHYERYVGTKATLHVFQRWPVLCPEGGLPRWVRRGPRPETEEMTLLHDFERAIRGDRRAGISGEMNLGTIALLDACTRSAEEGRRISLAAREEAHA